MNSEEKENPLEEVWLLTSNPNGKRVREHVFAEMGEKEMSIIADEITFLYDGFHEVIAEYVKSQIKAGLADGEWEIYINDGSGNMNEFIIVKVELDTGWDWSGSVNEGELPEEEREEVFRGSTVYATEGYYGDVDALYSAPTDYTTLEFEVE